MLSWLVSALILKIWLLIANSSIKFTIFLASPLFKNSLPMANLWKTIKFLLLSHFPLIFKYSGSSLISSAQYPIIWSLVVKTNPYPWSRSFWIMSLLGYPSCHWLLLSFFLLCMASFKILHIWSFSLVRAFLNW